MMFSQDLVLYSVTSCVALLVESRIFGGYFRARNGCHGQNFIFLRTISSAFEFEMMAQGVTFRRSALALMCRSEKDLLDICWFKQI